MRRAFSKVALFLAIVATISTRFMTPAKADTTLEREQQLLAAIQADDYNLVTKLLDLPELSIDQTFPRDLSWLEDAARACSSNVTPIFISGGLDPNRRNMIALPIIKITTPKCKQEALLLLSAGARIDFENNHNSHDHFLWRFADSCSFQQIAFMIQNGANPESRDSAGQNAIYRVVKGFHSPDCLRSIKVLFQHPMPPKNAFQINLDTLDVAGLRPIDWLNNCFHQFNDDAALEPQREAAILFLLQQGSPPIRHLTFAEGQAAYAKIRAAP